MYPKLIYSKPAKAKRDRDSEIKNPGSMNETWLSFFAQFNIMYSTYIRLYWTYHRRCTLFDIRNPFIFNQTKKNYRVQWKKWERERENYVIGNNDGRFSNLSNRCLKRECSFWSLLRVHLRIMAFLLV